MDVTDGYGWTELHLRVMERDLWRVQRLLAYGSSPNARSTKSRVVLDQITYPHNTTPLHIAARIGFLEAVHLLTDYGAELDAQDGNRCVFQLKSWLGFYTVISSSASNLFRRTSLQLATTAKRASCDVIEWLVFNGASRNTGCCSSNAARLGRIELLELLCAIDDKCEEVVDEDGRTALMNVNVSSFFWKSEVVAFLLALNVDTSKVTRTGTAEFLRLLQTHEAKSVQF
jgi:ankyrin repeat protein